MPRPTPTSEPTVECVETVEAADLRASRSLSRRLVVVSTVAHLKVSCLVMCRILMFVVLLCQRAELFADVFAKHGKRVRRHVRWLSG